MRQPDRRHNLRLEAELPAVVHTLAEDGMLGPPLEARLLDLSAGGARVVLGHALLKGADVSLRIGEGDAIISLSAHADVVWRDRPTPGHHTVGLRFTGLNPSLSVALSRTVLRLARALGQGSALVDERVRSAP